MWFSNKLIKNPKLFLLYTQKDDVCNKLTTELDKSHPQINKYPKGPGLTVITKDSL